VDKEEVVVVQGESERQRARKESTRIGKDEDEDGVGSKITSW
jgi:hypothetical protein